MLKERTGAIVKGPVQKVCGMMQRSDVSAGCRAGAMVLVMAALTTPGLAQADTVKNPIAVFAALDKVTGRISHLEIPINKTVEFGALKVTPRVCDTRPPTEAPHTSSFVEVDEVKLTGEVQRIFTGWMFAESPGLNPLLHPVFDVWLTSCSQPQRAPVAKGPQQGPGPAVGPGPNTAPQPPPEDDVPRRRRVPR